MLHKTTTPSLSCTLLYYCLPLQWLSLLLSHINDDDKNGGLEHSAPNRSRSNSESGPQKSRESKAICYLPFFTTNTAHKPLTIGSGSGSNTAADARLQCKNGARRLLRLHPRAKILFPCPGMGLLLVNSSAGDRCVRFHETAALRRICRTRLDLPPPPRWASTDGLGLFDTTAVLEGEGMGGTKNGSGGDDHGDGRAGIGTTECSLLDLVFLTELSVLLGLVGGRAEVWATLYMWIALLMLFSSCCGCC